MQDKNEKQEWQKFLKLCLKAQDVKTLENLFNLFFTGAEQEDLVKRYAIVRDLLAAKKTQREIAADLKLSIAKVTRGSNALRLIDAKLREFLLENIT